MAHKTKTPPPPLNPTLAQMIALVHAHRLLNFWEHLQRVRASHEQQQQAAVTYSQYVLDVWETIGPVIDHPDFQTINADLRTYI